MSKRTLLILTVFSLITAAGIAVLYKRSMEKKAGEMVKKSITSKKEATRGMTESERRAYVEKYIKIDQLVIEPDTQIGPEGSRIEIKGLLRVKGMARNEGDKSVSKAQLVLHIKNDAGDVIGTDIEDVLRGRNLSGGEERSFSFTIRDRKDFTDQYILKVR